MKKFLAILMCVAVLLNSFVVASAFIASADGNPDSILDTNTIIIGNCTNGTLEVSPQSAEPGETVTIYPKGTDKNYEVDKVYIQLGNNEAQELPFSDYGYTFVKTDDVTTVYADFIKRRDIDGDGLTNANDFIPMRKYILGVNESFDSDVLVKLDCNCDSVINLLDLVRQKKNFANNNDASSLILDAENALCEESNNTVIDISDTFSQTVSSVFMRSNTYSVTYKINSSYDTVLNFRMKMHHRNNNVGTNDDDSYNLSDLLNIKFKSADSNDFEDITGDSKVDGTLWTWDTDQIEMSDVVVTSQIKLKQGENLIQISPKSGNAAVIDSIIFGGDVKDLEFVKEGATVRFLKPNGKTIKKVYGKLNQSIKTLFPYDSQAGVSEGLSLIGWDKSKDTTLTKNIDVKAIEGTKVKLEAEDANCTTNKGAATISETGSGHKSVYMKQDSTGADCTSTIEYTVYFNGSKNTSFDWDITMGHRSSGTHTLSSMCTFSVKASSDADYTIIQPNGSITNTWVFKNADDETMMGTGNVGTITLKPGKNYLRIKGISALAANIDYITLKLANDSNRLNTTGKTYKTVLTAIENESNSKIANIRSSANMEIPQGSTVYYVSNNGSDSNDGTSTDTPWKTLNKVNNTTLPSGSYVCFKRGDTWRGQLVAKTGVTYTAYGTGAKPQLYGSSQDGANADNWTLVSGTTNVWKYNKALTDDVGALIFNHDNTNTGEKITLEKVGVLRNLSTLTGVDLGIESSYLDNTVVNSATMEEFTGYSSMEDGQFYHNTYSSFNPVSGFSQNYLYLCSETNPGTRYSSIEFLDNKSVIDVSVDNVTIDNLCIKYTGAHGVSAIDANGLICQNLEVGDIGGSIQTEPEENKRIVRYGNGIQAWGTFDGFTVNNCYVYNCFDAGITPQDTENGTMANISITNNVVDKCIYNIEYFTQGSINAMNISGNYLLNAGQIYNKSRIDVEESAFIKSWRYANNTSDFTISGNKMANAKDFVVETQHQSYDATEATFTNNIIVAKSTAYSACGSLIGTSVIESTSNWYSLKSELVKPFDESFEKYINNGFANENPNQCWFIYDVVEFGTRTLQADAATIKCGAGSPAIDANSGSIRLNATENKGVTIDYTINVESDVSLVLTATMGYRPGGTVNVADLMNFSVKTPNDSDYVQITTDGTVTNTAWYPATYGTANIATVNLKAGENHIRIKDRQTGKLVNFDYITLEGNIAPLQDVVKYEAENADYTATNPSTLISTVGSNDQSVYMNNGSVTIDYTINATKDVILDLDAAWGHRDGGIHALAGNLTFRVKEAGSNEYVKIETTSSITNDKWQYVAGEKKFDEANVGTINLKKGENHIRIIGAGSLKANFDYIILRGTPEDIASISFAQAN